MYARLSPHLTLAICLIVILVQKNFVQVVRAIELCLGMPIPGHSAKLSRTHKRMTDAMSEAASSEIFNTEVNAVLRDSIPIVAKLASHIGLDTARPFPNLNKDPITTRFINFECMDCVFWHLEFSFMDIIWQDNNPSNPADAAIGPQNYDDHLYYSYVRDVPRCVKSSDASASRFGVCKYSRNQVCLIWRVTSCRV